MAKWLILLAFLVITCRPLPEAGLPTQDQDAINFVWYQVYQRKSQPPKIVWVTQDLLNCYGNTGFAIDIHPAVKPLCVAGVYYAQNETAYVARPKGWHISSTAVAHEAMHAYLHDEYGDPDPSHERPEWGVEYGNLPSIMDYAVLSLRYYY